MGCAGGWGCVPVPLAAANYPANLARLDPRTQAAVSDRDQVPCPLHALQFHAARPHTSLSGQSSHTVDDRTTGPPPLDHRWVQQAIGAAAVGRQQPASRPHLRWPSAAGRACAGFPRLSSTDLHGWRVMDGNKPPVSRASVLALIVDGGGGIGLSKSRQTPRPEGEAPSVSKWLLECLSLLVSPWCALVFLVSPAGCVVLGSLSRF